MNLRRRFFPTNTAQQVPGQRVQVEVQLRPGGAEVTVAPPEPPPTPGPPPGPCDPVGPTWFSSFLPPLRDADPNPDAAQPAGAPWVGGYDCEITEDGRIVDLFEVSPHWETFEHWRIDGMVVNANPCDVRWEWESLPTWMQEDLHPQISVVHGMLRVAYLESWVVGEMGAAVVADAYSISTGAHLGQLRFGSRNPFLA